MCLYPYRERDVSNIACVLDVSTYRILLAISLILGDAITTALVQQRHSPLPREGHLLLAHRPWPSTSWFFLCARKAQWSLSSCALTEWCIALHSISNAHFLVSTRYATAPRSIVSEAQRTTAKLGVHGLASNITVFDYRLFRSSYKIAYIYICMNSHVNLPMNTLVNILWILYEYFMNNLWIIYEYFMNNLWIFYEYFMNILWIIQAVFISIFTDDNDPINIHHIFIKYS